MDDPDEDDSDHIPTLEPKTTKPEFLANKTSVDRQGEETAAHVLKTPHRQSETQEEQVPTPPRKQSDT